MLDAVAPPCSAGTGAPSSAYFFLALAGAWWAAHLPRRHSGALWAGGFAVVYLILVVPAAIADGMLVNALEDAAVVVIIGALSDWFVRVDARALALSEALANGAGRRREGGHPRRPHPGSPPMEISLDVLLAASREA